MKFPEICYSGIFWLESLKNYIVTFEIVHSNLTNSKVLSK